MTPGRRRLPLALLVAGLAFLALNAFLMLRLDWRPAVLPLPAQSSPEPVEQAFTTAATAPYEVQLEVSTRLPRKTVQRTVGVVDSPAPIDLDWTIYADEQIVATGDARDYMYLDGGPKGWPGRLRRILMRVPTGQDARFWKTAGLAGHTTVSRGVGGFQAEAGKTYRLSVRTRAGLEPLTDGDPKMVVRIARTVSHRHYQRISPVGYAGLALIFLGMLTGMWRLVAGPRG